MKTFKEFTEVNRHGIPKDATKAELEAIRSSKKSSKGKKNLAHYLLNMHHEEIKYDSSMGGHEWGTDKGTQYMKSKTPGEKKKVKEAKEMSKKDPVAKNMNKFNKPATHRDRKNDYSRKDKHKGKIYEEGEAGETKAEYRKDNEINAPEAGIVPLNDKDIRALEHDVDVFNWQMAIDLELYDEDELMDDIDSDDPHDEVQITEVLSVQGRLKRRFAARKNRQKLKVARNIALRRGSTPDRLKKRATRGARGLVYKRLLRGRSKTNMPPAEKARLEKMLKLYTPLVQRLSVRLLPNMRKMEIQRMKNRKGSAAKKSKKYKAARPVAKKQAAKKFKIKK